MTFQKINIIHYCVLSRYARSAVARQKAALPLGYQAAL